MGSSENLEISAGQRLRRAREERHLTLGDVARETRIKAEFLQALEEDRTDVFPGSVYARAFLREYAAFLGLDGEDLVSSLFPAARTELPEQIPSRRLTGGNARLSVAGMVLLVAAAAGAVFLAAGRELPRLEGDLPPPAAPAERPEKPRDATGVPGEAKSAPEQAIVPEARGVRLRLRAEAPCWIRVQSGGRLLYEGTLRAGDSLHFASREAIVLRVGNAGALRIRHNEGAEQVPGRHGEVVTRIFEPAEPDTVAERGI